MAYSLPLSVTFAFNREGWLCFLPVIYGFVLIPLLEFFFTPNHSNLTAVEAEVVAKDRLYDWVLYLMLPVQVGFVIWYLFIIREQNPEGLTFWGRTLSLGLMCGVLGINVAHELGHRLTQVEKVMARLLLSTSLYAHFYIEHNYGHHRNVATAEDPASARKNESLYAFWLRSIVHSYFEAWKLEGKRLSRKKVSPFSLQNEMLLMSIVQILMLVLMVVFFGWKPMLGFMAAAFTGILLLETVNYIEHYGLSRTKLSEFRYETTTPMHSWNSNHHIGRLMLFELSRHSDHHAHPHKKYQNLNSYEASPQMPTGYPGMMLLSVFPPLWFKVMNPRLPK